MDANKSENRADNHTDLNNNINNKSATPISNREHLDLNGIQQLEENESFNGFNDSLNDNRNTNFENSLNQFENRTKNRNISQSITNSKQDIFERASPRQTTPTKNKKVDLLPSIWVWGC